MTSTDARRVETTVGDERVVGHEAGDGDEAVLCVHGLASRAASLGPLVDVLAEHGYRALAPDLRGHGDSQGLRGRISRQRAVADLQAWSEWLAGEGTSVRAIVGHSLGGLWAMAAHRELGVDALAAVASPVSIRHELGALEQAAYRLGGGLQALVEPLGLQLRVPYRVGLEDVLETSEAIQTARRIELVQGSIPLANAGDLLAVDGARLAADVDVPAIVARPKRDELVAQASTRQLYDALREPRVWLELEGPHECFFDVDGRQAAQQLADSLEEVLASRG